MKSVCIVAGMLRLQYLARLHSSPKADFNLTANK